MKRRLFLGVSVPRDIAKYIDRKIEVLSALPVIWTVSENRHITLVFLGWVDDENLAEITAQIGRACENKRAFDVAFDRIAVAPEHNPDRIEITGEENGALCDLVNGITSALDAFSPDRKKFHPHITLGRVRRGAWKKIVPTPNVDVSVHFFVPLAEVTLFESASIDGKRQYIAIENFSLQ